MPCVSEEIYRGLTGERSVHLTDWPDASEFPEDRELVSRMERARAVCSAALALRRAKDVRVRQPLRSITVAGRDAEELRAFADLIRDEVNVRDVNLTQKIDEFAEFRLKVNARVLGPRLGGAVQTVIRAAREGEWSSLADGDGIEIAGQRLGPGDYELLLAPKEGVHCQALLSNDAIVVLDLELTPELEREGRARDLVRAIQQARRDAGLHVSDRIDLALELPDAFRDAAEQFRAYVSEQTLARDLALDAAVGANERSVHEARLGTDDIRIGLRKI